jgi:hypothetical protein
MVAYQPSRHFSISEDVEIQYFETMGVAPQFLLQSNYLTSSKI